jgi:hypothetical protein
MSPKVHADPSKFHQAADELHRMADELRQGGSRLLSATSDARSYDGQYAPWVRPIAQNGDHRIRGISERITSLAHTLDLIAQGFEEADRLDRKGFSSLADQVRLIVESGFVVSTFPHWLTHGQCPPWINQDFWNRLLLDDRDAFLASLGGAWLDFVESGDYSHATEQDMLNAFLVYLFMEGVLSKPPELEVWKSAARAAGMSLEDYVMKILGITPYDRDTVAGAGITETREVGPIAVLIVGQALINTTRSYELKGIDYYGFKKYANDIDHASDRFAGWGDDYKNKDQAEYLHLALDGKSNQNPFNPYTWERLGEGEDDMLAPLASAAQDSSWRLLAGYEVGDVTLFLRDEESEWWTYYQSMVDEGYTYPYSMDEAMAMVEKSYLYNNEYEGNVDNCWLESINPESPDSPTKYQHDIGSEIFGYELAAESLITIRGLGANNFGLVSHTEIGPILGGSCR